MSLSIDKSQEHPDVNRLDRASGGYWQGTTVRTYEDAVAAALATPGNVVLPRYGLHLGQRPVQRRPAHCLQQLRGRPHAGMILLVGLQPFPRSYRRCVGSVRSNAEFTRREPAPAGSRSGGTTCYAFGYPPTGVQSSTSVPSGQRT